MLRVNFKWGGSKHMMSMRSQMGVSALDMWKEEKKTVDCDGIECKA